MNLFNIYALVFLRDKKFSWESIRKLGNEIQMDNVILVGDMNITLSQEDKQGGSIVRDLAREWVEELIQDWDMLDVKPPKGKYTWTNRRSGPGYIARRLDRFLIQSFFLLLFLDVSYVILSSSVLDHKPIILELKPQMNLGPIPFRFSALWVQHSDLLDKVEEVWKQIVSGSPFFVWEENMSRVKRALKSWAKALPSPMSQGG